MTMTRTRTLQQLQVKMSTNGLRGARETEAVHTSLEDVARRMTALCLLAAITVRSRTILQSQSKMN